MRAVVTRPEIAGRRTAERLKALGHEPVLLPLAKAVHDLNALRAALRQQHDALAITSAEAMRALGELGDDLRHHLHTPLFAVGEASAAAARAIGFALVTASHDDGAALADLIGRQQPVPSTLLYLAGLPRAQGFEQRLTSAEIRFRVCESYRMQPIVPNQAALHHAFLATPADAVLLYSTETARRLFSLPLFHARPDLLSSLRILCLSEAIAAVVPPSQRSLTEVAAAPDEESLLALL